MTTRCWTPPPERVARSALHAFASHVGDGGGRDLHDYDALHAWSVEDIGRFWSSYAAWAALPFDAAARRIVSDDPMPETRWFEGARLNYARALIEAPRVRPDDEALVALDEAGHRRALTRAALRAEVARVQAALQAEGVGEGDRVAAYAVAGIEGVVALLACAGLGAVFTSCSPDFGFEAASARFAQVSPPVLLATPAYQYGGRRFAVHDVARRLAAGIRSIERLVWLPVAGEEPCTGMGGEAWERWLARTAGEASGEPSYASLPFDHPVYVLYSSGTTGVPKAIVHRAGGALLTHHKEHRLHCDVGPGDRVTYFTTMGWMMWNWVVSALAQGATVLLYDGSPTHPDPLALWRALARERVTFFGTGARYVHGLQASGVEVGDAVPLPDLRTIASTGSPLAPSGFRYVYTRIKPDVHLASISGGTDIVGCFMLGVPTLPVFEGQIQRPGLGVDLAVLDSGGREVDSGAGELVCRQPLPSMPVRFWGDEGHRRYREAYLERFPGVWCHGDLIERTSEGGVVVYGRSDATLNPGGVRIGTAEIYHPLETLPEVVEACAVGRRSGDDEEVWLLVVLADGVRLDEDLIARVRARIREAASPRHVPKRVLQVPQLPRTRSGKSMELAVRYLVNGQRVTNREVMANPEALGEIEAVLATLTP